LCVSHSTTLKIGVNEENPTMALRGLLLAVMLAMASSETATVNPIRRVVTMLQMMQKKVIAEGEKEQELFEKFMCYCKNGAGTLKKAIADAEAKIPQLESEIEAMGAEKVQLAADIIQHKKDRDAAKGAIVDATALREKEAATFAEESSDDSANLGAMDGAIKAISKGMGSAFLQSQAASALKNFVLNANIMDADRDALTSFLSQDSQYAPASGEIVGILKQMKDTMSAHLKDITAAEAKAKAAFKGLVAAKKKEIEALQKSIEEKIERVGKSGVELVNMAEDLEDTKEGLDEDKKFLADMAKNCATKKDEWAARQKTRSEELLALADTIKILNDDDALELFKKTLPTPSFLQITVTQKEVRRQAIAALKKGNDPRLDLISLALHGQKVDFSKVLKMIDDMVVLLGEEQVTDNDKKADCLTRFDTLEDEAKALARDVSNLEKNIADLKSSIETLTEEIAALEAGITDLDKQVAEATETRKEEHEDFVENLAANNAAKKLLEIAKNRLNKFYNPKLYKAPPKRELSEEERITVNMGGTLAPTAAPGGIAGTGVTVFAQKKVAPPPPPETFGAYSKKSEESSGVIGMIDLLKKDLTNEITEMEFDEKAAQGDYDKFVADSADKRAADSKSLAQKEEAKANAVADLVADEAELKSKQGEAMNNAKLTADTHLECDWLLENYDFRKEARAGEVDSLKKAKAILSGADYSFVQTAAVRRHLRG